MPQSYACPYSVLSIPLLSKSYHIAWKFQLLNHMFISFHNITPTPAGTQHQNDVVPTSMRRDHVASTLIRRHFNVVCPLARFSLRQKLHTESEILPNNNTVLFVCLCWGFTALYSADLYATMWACCGHCESGPREIPTQPNLERSVVTKGHFLLRICTPSYYSIIFSNMLV